MQRAFVVLLDLDDGDDIVATGVDLQDDLDSLGYNVLSVNPWDSKGTSQPTNMPPLA